MTLLKYFLQTSCVLLLAVSLAEAAPDMRETVKNAIKSAGLTQEKLEQIQKNKQKFKKEGNKEKPKQYAAIPLSSTQQTALKQALKAEQDKMKREIGKFLNISDRDITFSDSDLKTLRKKRTLIDSVKQFEDFLSYLIKVYPDSEIQPYWEEFSKTHSKENIMDFVASLFPDDRKTYDFLGTVSGFFWNYFLIQNEHVNQQISVDRIIRSEENFNDLTVVEGLPDYGEKLAGSKFIILSEGANHGEKIQLEESFRLLESIRKANPKARILLAEEHAETTVSCNQPLESKECLWPSPFRAARSQNDNIIISHEYKPVLALLDRLGIDLLALDSIYVGGLDYISTLQVGNKAIPVIISEDPLFNDGMTPKILEAYGEKDLDYALESVLDFIFRSPWGVVQRNRQWTRYIRAAEPYYDIIIVWAGAGHTAFGPNTITEEISRWGNKVSHVVLTAMVDDVILDKSYESVETPQQIFKFEPTQEEYKIIEEILLQRQANDMILPTSKENGLTIRTGNEWLVFLPPMVDSLKKKYAEGKVLRLFVHQGFNLPKPNIPEDKK